MFKIEKSIFKTTSYIEEILDEQLQNKFNITFTEFLILYNISNHDGCSITDIQNDIYYKMDSASMKTKKLRDLGYINKERRKDDERKICITITETGQSIVDTVLSLQNTVYRNVNSTFTKEDGELLYHLLEKYRNTFYVE